MQDHRQANAHRGCPVGRKLDLGIEGLVADELGEGHTGLHHITGLEVELTNQASLRGSHNAISQISLPGSQGLPGGQSGLTKLIALNCTGRAFTDQFFVALVVDLIGTHLCPQAGELGLQLGLIEHQDHITGAHQLPLTHLQLGDPPSDLAGELHNLLGIERCYGFDAVGKRLQLHRCSGNPQRGPGRFIAAAAACQHHEQERQQQPVCPPCDGVVARSLDCDHLACSEVTLREPPRAQPLE